MRDVPSDQAVTREGLASQVQLPPIVSIVLQQAARLLRGGELDQAGFEEKLARLKAEELTPRGLALLVRELPDGATRFLIKELSTARVLEMIDCGARARPAETKADRAATTPPPCLALNGAV